MAAIKKRNLFKWNLFLQFFIRFRQNRITYLFMPLDVVGQTGWLADSWLTARKIHIMFY